MKRFIRNSILFFLFLGFIMYVVDYMITTGLRKSDVSTYAVWNDIYNAEINSDVIIMGSSRAWYQYNPQILDSVVGLNFYNLGSNGQLIDYQIIRYNTFRRFNNKPKYIIQNIDFLTLGICDYVYAREQFLPYVSDDSLMSVIGGVQQIDWTDVYIPLIRYANTKNTITDGLQSFFGKKRFSNGGLYKGYKGEEVLWNGIEFNKIDTIFYEKDPRALRLFGAYLKQCQEENIKVLFVSAPVYVGATNKIYKVDQMNKMFRNIAKKYDMQILDYTSDSICMDTTYFCNATHLNKKGAEAFSFKLGTDLKRLGWK